MRTLIVAPNWIGDAVMSQPLLALLRAQRPAEPIDALCPPHIAPVYRAMAEVDEIIEAPNVHGRLDLAARWRLGRHLRARGYARALVLPNSAKSALVPRLAGIPLRIGHRGEVRGLLLNRLHDDTGRSRERPPMVEHYARLACAPGQTPGAPVPAPKLQIAPAEVAAARARLGLPAEAPLFALCPGAEYGPAKRWPVRHFAALADLVAQRWPDAVLVVLGGPKDRPVGDEIARLATAHVRNLCGETSLSEAMALLSQAGGVVSNDSGLMHVSAAFDRPMVALFGSSDPRHTPPRSPRASVLWLQLDCSPCFQRECPLGHLDCLERISPEQALQALARTLDTR